MGLNQCPVGLAVGGEDWTIVRGSKASTKNPRCVICFSAWEKHFPPMYYSCVILRYSVNLSTTIVNYHREQLTDLHDWRPFKSIKILCGRWMPVRNSRDARSSTLSVCMLSVRTPCKPSIFDYAMACIWPNSSAMYVSLLNIHTLVAVSLFINTGGATDCSSKN